MKFPRRKVPEVSIRCTTAAASAANNHCYKASLASLHS